MNVDVIVPVGPFENDKKWLDKCVMSLTTQTHKPTCIVFVDDQAHLEESSAFVRMVHSLRTQQQMYRVIRNSWRLGCADSWNIGIAESPSAFAFMMGADDWLEPTCLEALVAEYRRIHDDRGYYYPTLQYHLEAGAVPPYNDGTLIEDKACNAAMVSKGWWKSVGGYPPEAGLGAPDAIVVSLMFAYGGKVGNLRPVAKGTPLYNVRVHAGRDTSRQGRFHTEVVSVRDKLTADWKPCEWAR